MAYDFSENIQRSILYLLKSNRDFYLQIVNLVKPEYFEFPSHSKLFETVREHYEKYGKLPNDEFIVQDIKGKLTTRESASDYEDELLYINNLDLSATSNPESIAAPCEAIIGILTRAAFKTISPVILPLKLKKQ